MTTWFISRHSGAIEWAASISVGVDRWARHLEIDAVDRGDVVIGTLPVHLAAEVCRYGARYLHLVLDLPEQLRGTELTAVQLTAAGARLVEFQITKIGEG